MFRTICTCLSGGHLTKLSEHEVDGDRSWVEVPVWVCNSCKILVNFGINFQRQTKKKTINTCALAAQSFQFKVQPDEDAGSNSQWCCQWSGFSVSELNLWEAAEHLCLNPMELKHYERQSLPLDHPDVLYINTDPKDFQFRVMEVMESRGLPCYYSQGQKDPSFLMFFSY